MLYLLSGYLLFKQFCGKCESKCLDREFKNLCMFLFCFLFGFFFFFRKLYISNQKKNTTEKKLVKMEMSDLSDERNLDKSKVLSV